MKKSLAVLAVLGCFSQSSMAVTYDMDTLLRAGTATAQTTFRTLSEDLGAALSYKPLTPAAPLGITGFDLGIEVTATDTAKSSAAWKQVTGSELLNTTYVPKLHVAKGLPFGIDVAAFYSAIPTTSITFYGAELRYAILEGGITMPAIAVRGAMTQLNGIDKVAFNTKSVDISISKGFAMVSPYAGVGQVWVDSSTTATTTVGNGATSATVGLAAEKFAQSKVFVGANLNLGLVNIAAEVDKTGGIQSTNVKVGFRW